MDAFDGSARWVVVGSGSAGHRHAAALRAADPTARITVVRRPTSVQPSAWLQDLGVEVVPTVADAVGLAPTLAVVAGPAPMHAEAATMLLAAGADVLVEKPLAATVADGETIAAAARGGDRAVVVGYHLRVDEVVAAFRAGLDRLGGEVDHVELHVGQHLDQWRPAVDAARSVTARHELGGGVLLELSHELDAAQWCFGPIASVTARLGVDGAPTDGVVETVADLAIVGTSGLTGTIHLDMVSPAPRRAWRATGPAGSVEADLLAGTVRGTGAADGIDVVIASGWRDRAEGRLIAGLLAVHEPGAVASCSVEDALDVLRVIDAARASARAEGAPVDVVRSAVGSQPVDAAGGSVR